MAIIGDALRQAFMPKHEYENLREEERAWGRIQRPVLMGIVTIIWIAVIVSAFISLKIVFPADEGRRLFCRDQRLKPLPINVTVDSDIFPGAFYLTEQEAADYYWLVVFIPSAIIFLFSIVYLLAGFAVAYSAPTRHGCLRVVENNYCASKRGGVRCLSILNGVFAIIFGLLAMFLGSSLLTLGSSCSLPLFWCYEIASWGLVILYGGTAFFLRRKAAVILDESDFAGRNLGLEMLEATPLEVTPEIERRVNEGFKAWMGSSLLSSDEEDGPDDYQDMSYPTRTNSSRQRA
ncbi:hypothetical protein HHK36_025654 [Tetracentron sinense]|uniref:Transmembrane protein n=1 Tax=Tetracentron sinense TaxID=13715 RepID=A0A834YJ51_TETSI|nr:hypothetical protein HHK36_025654 [Tetracentron sinense]